MSLGTSLPREDFLIYSAPPCLNVVSQILSIMEKMWNIPMSLSLESSEYFRMNTHEKVQVELKFSFITLFVHVVNTKIKRSTNCQTYFTSVKIYPMVKK